MKNSAAQLAEAVVGSNQTIYFWTSDTLSQFEPIITAMKIPTLSLLTLIAVTYAAPQQQYNTPIPIVSQTQDGPNPDGSYQYSYQTGNGIGGQERGYLKNPGTQNEAQVAEGGFSYTAPDGQVISLQYLSDDGGFQPQGAHLPTPPPIPPEIQRALQFLATQPQQNYGQPGITAGGYNQG